MFITKCKLEKLWKFVNGLVIIFGPDPQEFSITAIIETRSANFFVDISEVKEWFDKKKTYEIGFEQAKKKYFISVNKFYLATILKLSSSEEMFKALNKKYFAINAIYLHQLLCNCQAISTKKILQ